MRLRQRMIAIGVAMVLALLLLLNVRLHSPGNNDTVSSQLRFLEASLSDGGGERMQRLFPEGYVFTWALYGLASAQVARGLPADSPDRSVMLGRAREATEHLDSDLARSTFDASLDPPYGAFYCAWSLYVRAEYIRAAGTDSVSLDLIRRFESDCQQFADALERSETPFLSSYSGSAWPADTCPGIAALALHDRLLSPRFERTIENWLARVKQSLDPERHALSHSADPVTGEPRGGVRGSSLALMCRLLCEATPDFSREQYAILRDQFADFSWGVPVMSEYPRGISGPADVDSGPIFLGGSGPAMVVGAGAARVFGDEALAAPLFGVVETAGFPIEWRGSRHYFLGTLPVGDAFIGWARTSTAADGFRDVTWADRLPFWWAWPTHLLSLAIAGMLIAGVLWVRKRKATRR